MTTTQITHAAPSASPSPPATEGLTWTHVDPSLWVASTRWEFIGTVELVGERYLACDRYAIEIGSFGSLDAAKRQVQSPASSGLERTERSPDLHDRRLAWATAVVAAAVIVGSICLAAAGLLS
jgi:hypothetical protein